MISGGLLRRSVGFGRFCVKDLLLGGLTGDFFEDLLLLVFPGFGEAVPGLSFEDSIVPGLFCWEWPLNVFFGRDVAGCNPLGADFFLEVNV